MLSPRSSVDNTCNFVVDLRFYKHVFSFFILIYNSTNEFQIFICSFIIFSFLFVDLCCFYKFFQQQHPPNILFYQLFQFFFFVDLEFKNYRFILFMFPIHKFVVPIHHRIIDLFFAISGNNLLYQFTNFSISGQPLDFYLMVNPFNG